MTLQAPQDLAAVRAFLDAARLPTDDLDALSADDILTAEADGRLVGTVAVERFGDHGLLRSVAVAPDARGTGLGGRLVDAAEALARAQGLVRLVLLTTTAAPFFQARGYAPIDRADVPEAVRQSRQFRGLCPASAVCLGKALPPA